MSNGYDFTGDTLKIRLLCPFSYRDYRDENGDGILIDAVVIKRLYAPDISQLRSNILSTDSDTKGMFLKGKELTAAFVENFISENKPVTSVSNNILIMQMPYMNLEKINLFGMMVLRETSRMKTSYKCRACDQTTIFDLDPAYPIPKDVEFERELMEDFLAFYSEKVNREGLTSYILDVKDRPVMLEDEEGNPLEVTQMEFRWPTVGDFLKSVSDRKRNVDIELWTYYDCLVGINELTEDETKKLKAHNGCEKVMRLRDKAYSRLVDGLNQFSVRENHSYVCKHCGTLNEQGFDYSNFFELRGN